MGQNDVLATPSGLGANQDAVREECSGTPLPGNSSSNIRFKRSCEEVDSRNSCHFVNTVIAIHLQLGCSKSAQIDAYDREGCANISESLSTLLKGNLHVPPSAK